MCSKSFKYFNSMIFFICYVIFFLLTNPEIQPTGEEGVIIISPNRPQEGSEFMAAIGLRISPTHAAECMALHSSSV